MKKKKIDIQSIITKSTKEELKKLLGCTIKRIRIGGNFEIHSNYRTNSFIGNQVNLSCAKFTDFFSLSVFSKLVENDIYGEYDRIFVKSRECLNAPFSEEKEMLLRNRGILNLETLERFEIQGIDIYGVKTNNFTDHDEDFPEEDTIISADIDLLVRINSKNESFITCYVESGRTKYEWHYDSSSFDDFISNSQNYWGELKAIRYKYSIL